MTTTVKVHQIHNLIGRKKVAAACITCGTRCAFTHDPEAVLAWVEAHTDGEPYAIDNAELTGRRFGSWQV